MLFPKIVTFRRKYDIYYSRLLLVKSVPLRCFRLYECKKAGISPILHRIYINKGICLLIKQTRSLVYIREYAPVESGRFVRQRLVPPGRDMIINPWHPASERLFNTE